MLVPRGVFDSVVNMPVETPWPILGYQGVSPNSTSYSSLLLGTLGGTR